MPVPSFRLDGRRALITGASSGLGQHFAETLAQAGAEVVLAAR
ncbi:MAG: SDR family NAD(P)-dependent oxidoreductase, partial [Moraxellaceae bacterium]|nr:SDR family NAD(P)-dependent oxidoreductase [Moraxellaceae bacterium]